MLTNNKKGLFVKGISMMLAVLMVLAVALTGCTDSDAQKKIEDLQTDVDNKADKADVAADISKAITEALKDYLKASDAVTEAAIKDLIEKSAADYAKKSDLDGLATTEALKGYVQSSDFNALKESLKGYVTSADVTKAIEAYVATEAFKEAIKNAGGSSLSRADIEKIVKEVLAEGKYVNEDEVKKAIEETMKVWFGELDAKSVQKILTDLKKQMDAEDSPMTEKEWDNATELVIATIDSIQNVLKKCTTEIYTKANKAAINEAVKPLGISVFAADGTVNDQATMTKLIEYRILRVASVKEIEDLKTAVDTAGAIESFQDEWNKVVIRLYALGQYVDTFSAATCKDNEVRKNADKVTYHGKNYAKNSNKQTQVVTIADKADFQTLSEDVDDLLLKYTAENLLTDTPFAGLTITDVYSVTTTSGSTTTTTYNYEIAKGTYKDSPYKTDSSANAPAGYKYLTSTVFGSQMHTYDRDSKEVYGLNFDAILGTFSAGYTFTKNYKDVANDNKVISDVDSTFASTDGAASYAEWGKAYDAILAMLKVCQTKVNTANTKFQLFITDTLTKGLMDGNAEMANAKKLALANAALVDRLTADMSEKPETTNPYAIYLTKGTDTTGADNVAQYMDASNAINNNYTDPLFRYDLYLELIGKSNVALFPKYQAIALNVLDKMYNDYYSVVLAAATISGNAGSAITVDGVDFSKLNTTNYTGVDFLKAYINADGAVSYQIGPKDVKYPGLAGLYANNGLAKVLADNRTVTAVTSDVLAALKNNSLTLSIELKASTVGVRAAINSKTAADLADGSVKAINAFDDLLKQAMANLDEIMYRYEVEEVKKAVLNEMTAYAAERATYYSTINTANVAPLTAAVQKYLTGAAATVDPAAIDAALLGFTFEEVKNADGTAVIGYTLKSKENDVFAGMNNRALYDQLTTITVNMNDSIDGVAIGTSGTTAYKAVMAAKEGVKATIENMSVKYNFNDYLDDASTNARMALYSYTQLSTASWTYEDIMAFQAAYNETLGMITIEQYTHNRNGIALEEYKTRYVGKILSSIVKAGDTHAELVNGKGADSFKELLKAVKSSQVAPKGNWTVGPVRPIKDFVASTPAAGEGANDYLYAGSLAVALDKIANAKTVYSWTEGGANKTANLY